jgi:hypothetical protein
MRCIVLRCEECREYVMELFPTTLRDEETKQKMGVLLCLACVPKCEYGPAGGSGVRCCEPVDHRSEYFCTAHQLAGYQWDLDHADDNAEAIAEALKGIAEFGGEAVLARAA